MKNLSSVIWGLLLIVIGIILGGNALAIWNIDIFFDGWWTLFILIPCLVSILRNGFKLGNLTGLFVGGVLLASCWDIFPWHLIWKLFIPAIFVVIGLGVLFNKGNKNHHNQSAYPDNHKTIASFCSSTETNLGTEEYFGGKVRAVMGSTVVDLRNATIPSDIRIKVDVLMGSAELFFPPYVNLVVNSDPFLGSVENKASQCNAVNAPTIYMDCSAVLGGIELK